MIWMSVQRQRNVLFVSCISLIVWVQWQSVWHINAGLERHVVQQIHTTTMEHHEGGSTRTKRIEPIIIAKGGSIRPLPRCDGKSKADWIECEQDDEDTEFDDGSASVVTIDVVLGVYRRNNIIAQLEMIANQTLLPQTVFIIQNEDHVPNIRSVVEEWYSKNASSTTTTTTTTTTPSSVSSVSPFNISWIYFSQDSGYHGRFHIAYFMSRARYVSIWDDDLTVRPGWLAHVVDVLEADRRQRRRAHKRNDEGGMIVSSGGRVLRQLPTEANDWNAEYGLIKEFRPLVEMNGQLLASRRVDFTVQHHTLQRTLLRHYLGAPVLTYATGEDLQLNFALQRAGVQAHILTSPSTPNTTTTDATTTQNHSETAWASADLGMGANGEFASWMRKAQEPRLWLLCQLVLEGFPFDDCLNCNNRTAHACVHHFESTGSTMRHRLTRQQKKDLAQSRAGAVAPMDISRMTPREIARYYRPR